MKLANRSDGREDARPLVLSNSLGTTTELWEAQLPALTGAHRVVRYDHPGHGLSPTHDQPLTVELLAEGVLELLDRLELARVSFCGLSLGGMVGMALARKAPERVERLVLCCTAAHLGPPEGWSERARLVREGGMRAVAETVVGRWFTDDFRAGHADTVSRFREMLESTPAGGYAACCEAIALWDARDDLDGISVPTLVIAGADDVVTSPDEGAFLAEAIPRATLQIVPGAAHLANVEQPGLFDEALLGFLSSSDASEEAA